MSNVNRVVREDLSKEVIFRLKSELFETYHMTIWAYAFQAEVRACAKTLK